MRQFIIMLLLLMLPLLGITQDCPYYKKYIQKGNIALVAGKKGKKGQFEAAINAYSTALLHCPKKANIARAKILEVFKAIEELRKKAEIAERKAKQKTKEVEQAKARVEAQKTATTKALAQVQAEQAKTKKALATADALNAKNQKLIDAFYFYEGRFALAYKNGKFGFIDKNGNILINYEYSTLEQFGKYGLAKGSFCFEEYLIDTTGKKYISHFNIREANNSKFSFEALHLSSNDFSTIDSLIKKNQQLKLLLLDNEITYITDDFGTILYDSNCQTVLRENTSITAKELLNLQSLLLTLTSLKQLESLSFEDYNLGKLPIYRKFPSSLKSLYLIGNRFSQKEKSRIISLLPKNCKVVF